MKRHGASLSLAYIQSIAAGDPATQDANVKVFGCDQIIHRNDEMIQRFSDGHKSVSVQLCAPSCLMNQSAI